MRFRKYEVWEDYWCYEPVEQFPFEVLKTLNFHCWAPRKDDKINVRIETNDDLQSPTPDQIKAYEFIVQNEQRILAGIWDYYQQLILPVYQAATDIEPEQIASQPSELSTVLGATAIEIPTLQSPSAGYFLIQFDFQYDCEHGLYLLFRNDQVIDLFGEGDKNYDAINLYEHGLHNADNTPLSVHVSQPDGTQVFEGECYFDAHMTLPLAKGAYRIFFTHNDFPLVRNFIVTDDLDVFSLEYVLKNCTRP